MNIDEIISEIEGCIEKTERNSAQTRYGKAAITRELNAYRAAITAMQNAVKARRQFSRAYMKWLEEWLEERPLFGRKVKI
jgi:hypothetical protein